MLALKNRFNQSVKDRNAVGMTLLDRNDELCILYEKLNVQTNILNNGQNELVKREDEIRKLEIVFSNFNREIELLKNLKPKVGEYNESISKLKDVLEETRSRALELSARMESPDDPKRCRYLGGEDPDQQDLMEKIRNLEEVLAEKEVSSSIPSFYSIIYQSGNVLLLGKNSGKGTNIC